MAKKMVSEFVRYKKVPTDDAFVDLQYRKPESKIPWKGIGLAVFLFLVGSALIVVASLLFAGYISGKHFEGAWPLLILGILMFIPGLYHVRIAYYAYKGYPGYVFEEIPDFD